MNTVADWTTYILGGITGVTAFTDFINGIIVVANPSFWNGITFWEALSAAWVTSAVMVFSDFLQGIPAGILTTFKVLEVFGMFQGYSMYVGFGATIVSALLSWAGWAMADNWIYPYWASINRQDVGNWSATIMKIYETVIPIGVLAQTFRRYY